MTQRMVFRDLHEMAAYFERQGQRYHNSRRARSRTDDAFNKGHASALFTVAETIRNSRLDPDVPPEAA